MQKATYFIFLVFLLSSSCSSKQEQNRNYRYDKMQRKQKPTSYLPKFPPPDKHYIKNKRRDIHAFYKNNLKNQPFNGLFLVAKNGKIIYEKNNGYADYAKKTKLKSSTPLHVASISKVATSLAILRLFDQQQLQLDEDVRNYLPDLPYAGISIRMLLNHRSGIPYYGYFTYDTWKKDDTLTNQDLVQLLKKHKFPLNFKPDSHFTYCNTNFALLALIVEKVTGQPFPIAMKSLIFDPLKMKHSFILERYTDKNSLSKSYSSNRIEQAFDYLDGIYGDKNMYSTARDLLKMDRGSYCSEFLSQAAIAEIFKGYSYESSGAKNYGLGIRMVEEKDKDTYFYHTGWWHGNTGCYASLRADTVCIIALSNVYTKNVFHINQLSPYFGNYPFEKEN